MLEYVVLGITIGVAATLLVQDLIAVVLKYRAEKQAELDAIAASRSERSTRDHDPYGCGCHDSWDEHERFMLRGTTANGGVAGFPYEDPFA
jgi:hypothetical protein